MCGRQVSVCLIAGPYQKLYYRICIREESRSQKVEEKEVVPYSCARVGFVEHFLTTSLLQFLSMKSKIGNMFPASTIFPDPKGLSPFQGW